MKGLVSAPRNAVKQFAANLRGRTREKRISEALARLYSGSNIRPQYLGRIRREDLPALERLLPRFLRSDNSSEVHAAVSIGAIGSSNRSDGATVFPVQVFEVDAATNARSPVEIRKEPH